MPRLRRDQVEIERDGASIKGKQKRPRKVKPFLIEAHWHWDWPGMKPDTWRIDSRFAKQEDRDAQLAKLRRVFPNPPYKVEFRPVDLEVSDGQGR